MREGCGLPRIGCVAPFAVMGKVQSQVVRRMLVLLGVARITVRGDRLESPAGVAACTVESGMSAFERVEIVLKVRPCPACRSMAAFAVCHPAVRQVVGGVGLCETPLMAQLALHRRSFILTDGRLEMAALTGSHGMRGNEMETRPGMLRDQPCWRPVHLSVASLAIQSKRRGVRIGVAPATATGDISRDRSSVVMTS